MIIKLWKYILTILAFGIMLSQAKQVEPRVDAMGERLENVPYEVARFPVRELSSDEMKSIGYLAGTNEHLSEVWLPSIEEIGMLEARFVTTLQAMSRWETPEVLASLNEYRRQYIGVVINDQRLIVASYDRCSAFEKGQLEAYFIPFLPNDGGSCFIETLYNPVTLKFESFNIHGEA